MSESLTDQIKSFFDKEDVNNFKDKNYKKNFIDKVAEETKGDRKSIDTIFGGLLKKKLKNENISQEGFFKSRGKKFSSSLDLQNDTKPVEVKEEPKKEDEKFPKAQNPKVNDKEYSKEIPSLAPVGTSLNMFLGAIFDNLEDLTETEREDIGACIEMAFGDYIRTHDNVRKVMGGAGMLGIYGRKIKKARRVTKELKKQKQEEEPPEEPPEEPIQLSEEDIQRAKENIENYTKTKFKQQ